MVEPRLGPLRDALEARLGRPVLMTGSGSTLFALFASAGEAADAARDLEQEPQPELASGWVAATASGTPYPPEVVIEEGRP
jgi:4-diphosphocytidyl-2C-methyl-D-erythritol kinase